MVFLGVLVKIIVCIGFQPQCVLVKYEVLADYIYIRLQRNVCRALGKGGRIPVHTTMAINHDGTIHGRKVAAKKSLRVHSPTGSLSPYRRV